MADTLYKDLFGVGVEQTGANSGAAGGAGEYNPGVYYVGSVP